MVGRYTLRPNRGYGFISMTLWLIITLLAAMGAKDP